MPPIGLKELESLLHTRNTSSLYLQCRHTITHTHTNTYCLKADLFMEKDAQHRR